VGTEVQHHLLLTAAKNHGVCEGGETRADLDRSTTSVSKNAPLVRPTVDVAHPASNQAVHKGGPDEGEEHEGNETATLFDGTCNNSACEGAELHLVEGVEKIRDEWSSKARCSKCVHETEFLQVTDKTVRRVLAESQRVSPEVPLECDDREKPMRAQIMLRADFPHATGLFQIMAIWSPMPASTCLSMQL
jgi:hypothetical protein